MTQPPQFSCMFHDYYNKTWSLSFSLHEQLRISISIETPVVTEKHNWIVSDAEEGCLSTSFLTPDLELLIISS